MVPEAFFDFFLGSVGASAALIGLLFVAVSVAPERVFGRDAPAGQSAVAISAFFALLNAFFVSIVALIPTANIGYAAVAVAVASLLNMFGLGQQLWEEWHQGRKPRIQRFTLLAGSFVLYGWEIGLGVALIASPRHMGYVYGLTYLLLGTYSLGLGRAWELLGAPDEGIFTLLNRRRAQGAADRDAHPEDSDPLP